MTFINGVDCDHYPSDATMGQLREHGGFRVTGFYLAHYPGKPDQSWIAKRSYLAANGWGFIPTYVGFQKKPNGPDPFGANAGDTSAAEAVALMKQAGFATPSVVYLDLESGDQPDGSYAAYVSSWISGVQAQGYTPALYCSHRLISWARAQVKIVWSFHIPAGTDGQSYDPDNLPTGLIDSNCIATQYRQNIGLNGIALSSQADSGGFDLDLSLVADPSNFASVHDALKL